MSRIPVPEDSFSCYIAGLAVESLPCYFRKFCTRIYSICDRFLEDVDDVLPLAIKKPGKCIQQIKLDGSDPTYSTDPEQDSSNPEASLDPQLDGSNSASNSGPKLDGSSPASISDSKVDGSDSAGNLDIKLDGSSSASTSDAKPDGGI